MEERGVVQRMAEVGLRDEDCCGEPPNGLCKTDSYRLVISNHCAGAEYKLYLVPSSQRNPKRSGLFSLSTCLPPVGRLIYFVHVR